jgi:hypothetical protein
MSHTTHALAILAIVGALLACKASASTGSDLRARVTCQGSTETIDCDVAHTGGDVAANVCWDLSFSCENGTTVTGSGFCQSVQPNATAQKRIPLTELESAASCDKALSSEVKNLQITAL